MHLTTVYSASVTNLLPTHVNPQQLLVPDFPLLQVITELHRPAAARALVQIHAGNVNMMGHCVLSALAWSPALIHCPCLLLVTVDIERVPDQYVDIIVTLQEITLLPSGCSSLGPHLY